MSLCNQIFELEYITRSQMGGSDNRCALPKECNYYMPLHFLGADIPTVPLLSVVVNRTARVFGERSIITVRLDWMRPENFDQFDIDRYDITVTSTSSELNLTLACGECTNTEITVSENLNNVRMNTTFTATIAAVNLCGETGPTTTASYTISKLYMSLLINSLTEPATSL